MLTRDDTPIDTDITLADFFLGRLTALVSHQATVTDRAKRTMLAQAAFSIFLDCLDLGLVAEARAIMGAARSAPLAARSAISRRSRAHFRPLGRRR